MAYINELNFNVNNIFTYYTPYYNHYWLFFISDLNTVLALFLPPVPFFGGGKNKAKIMNI